MIFHADRLSGSNLFATFFDAIPIDSSQKITVVAKFLDVSTKSIKYWLSGTRCPPRAAVIALFHESPYGLSATSSHSQQAATLSRLTAAGLASQNYELSLVIDALRAELDTLKRDAFSARTIPMNDSVYDRAACPD